MLWYVTSVIIPAVNAQSVQIYSNSLAFSRIIDDFVLVSPKNNSNEEINQMWWKRIGCFFRSGRLKYLEFAFRSILIGADKNITIYTRDILIALLFCIKGHEVIYEAHQKPSWKASFIINKLKRNKLRFVCISEALRSYFIGAFSIEERNIIVAHDGAFVENYQKAEKIDVREVFGISDDKKILLHTGSLYKGRGAELFEYILSNFDDLVIAHVGGTQENIDFWINEIHNERFFALPHVSNNQLIRLQKSADYLLYPMTRQVSTYWCCSPMKMFEYLASQRPIISTSVGSIKEVLNEGNAFLFDPDDQSTLLQALEKCFSNKEEASRRASNAFNDAQKKYDWSKRADSIKNFVLRGFG